MLELLLASDIIFAPNAAKAFQSIQGGLDRLYESPWLLDNIDTLFALVQRLPIHSQQRLPMLKQIWREVPATCRERLSPILTNRGDMDAISTLGCNITPTLQMHFLPLDNLPVLHWCCDQLAPANEIPIVELASLAYSHCSMEVLDHLVQEHQDTMAPHFLQSQKVLSQQLYSVAQLQWLQQHCPAASDNISRSASVDMATLRWLQQHRQDPPCKLQALRGAIKARDIEVLMFFTEHYPDVLSQAGVLNIPSCIRQIGRTGRGLGTSFCFAKSAIAANNIHWLREVAVDFGATLSDFCSMARLYALEQLPLLQQPFEEDGVTLSRGLLDQYGFNCDPIKSSRGGHLGMLQFILGNPDVCSQCIAVSADKVAELNIVARCSGQDWTACAKHSIQA
ncbi:hypothetical protein RI367_007875 [Sorochytrium milnesiophthora]